MSHIRDDLRLPPPPEEYHSQQSDTDHARDWTKLVSPFDLETTIETGDGEHDVEDELLEASLEEYQ